VGRSASEDIGETKQAQAVVDCVFSTITKALKKKDTVTLIGFGTLKGVQRKAMNKSGTGLNK